LIKEIQSNSNRELVEGAIDRIKNELDEKLLSSNWLDIPYRDKGG